MPSHPERVRRNYLPSEGGVETTRKSQVPNTFSSDEGILQTLRKEKEKDRGIVSLTPLGHLWEVPVAHI